MKLLRGPRHEADVLLRTLGLNSIVSLANIVGFYPSVTFIQGDFKKHYAPVPSRAKVPLLNIS